MKPLVEISQEILGRSASVRVLHYLACLWAENKINPKLVSRNQIGLATGLLWHGVNAVVKKLLRYDVIIEKYGLDNIAVYRLNDKSPLAMSFVEFIVNLMKYELDKKKVK